MTDRTGLVLSWPHRETERGISSLTQQLEVQHPCDKLQSPGSLALAHLNRGLDMGLLDWAVAQSLSLVATGSGPTNYYTDTAELLPPAPHHRLLHGCAIVEIVWDH